MNDMTQPAHPPILFEDGEALVIDKPAGLPVDPPRRGGPSLENHYDALRLGFQRYPNPVHRLDTDTSGCLLLARNPKALKRFAKAFEDRRVEKRYIGLVAGSIAEDSGTIDIALSKTSSAERGWRMVGDPQGKPSTTHWEVLERADGLTAVLFKPVTGRTHQIRIHALEGLSFPLVGDPVYGMKNAAVARTMLHASAITVTRDNKPPVDAIAPLPTDFAALCIEAGMTDMDTWTAR